MNLFLIILFYIALYIVIATYYIYFFLNSDIFLSHRGLIHKIDIIRDFWQLQNLFALFSALKLKKKKINKITAKNF